MSESGSAWRASPLAPCTSSRRSSLSTLPRPTRQYLRITEPTMRLINIHTLRMSEFFGAQIPPYITLSHRWTDDEIDFKDFQKGRRKDSIGYKKVLACCEAAKSRMSFTVTDVDCVSFVNTWTQRCVDWIWVDTCCIDKRSSSEIEEAIRSMYEWYARSVVCFAYLADVDDSLFLETAALGISGKPLEDNKSADHAFSKSEWFTRGWTLQELLAPGSVWFFTNKWRRIGTKQKLESRISTITRIPCEVLRNSIRMNSCCVAQKMSWLSRRKTTRPEDGAYCALGIFRVHMPLLYGEGKNAFLRLQDEIIKATNDESIFAWQNHPSRPLSSAILASGPLDFEICDEYRIQRHHARPAYRMTNQGLELRLLKGTVAAVRDLRTEEDKIVVVPLNCSATNSRTDALSMYLRLLDCGHYERVGVSNQDSADEFLSGNNVSQKDMTVYVHTSGAADVCRRLLHTLPEGTTPVLSPLQCSSADEDGMNKVGFEMRPDAHTPDYGVEIREGKESGSRWTQMRIVQLPSRWIQHKRKQQR